MSGDTPDSPDLEGIAELEARTRAQEVATETLANRPTQNGPRGSTTWDSVNVDPESGRPIHQDFRGIWQYSDVELSPNGVPVNPMDQTGIQPNGVETGMFNKTPGKDWTQNVTLNPEWQESLDRSRELMDDQTDYRSGVVKDWTNNGIDYSDIGGDNISTTIGRGDLDQFGQQNAILGADDWRQFGTTNPNMGSQDWRQFGTTDQTIGAGQWQNQGNSDPTIGADDWRQFGQTGQTINSGDWDARFGNNDQSGGFGDHGMGGSDWDTVQYTPEALRNKAEQQTLAFMNAQLDPQWDTRQNDLEVKLTNQGLQPGDAAWDNAMASMSRSRDSAYSGARNQALADSRAEANMLWGQEMSRSEQKNQQTQADLDNIYRARQSNIQNYQGQRAQDMQGFLDYQNSAFDQDFKARQQTLNANLDYGNSAFQQDFQSRQQSLDAQLGYGREAFNQDFQGRQQQLDANRMYSSEAFNQDLRARQQTFDTNRLYAQEAFDQDYRSRQANITNYLNYGNAEFGQNLSKSELDLQARRAQEELEQGRYDRINPNETSAGITAALA